MPECTFIFKTFVFLFFLLCTPGYAPTALAQPSAIPPGTNPAELQPAIPPSGSAAKKDEPGLFDQSSPYMEYGDFNSSDDEENESIFYQYGRFFGLSLGVGYEAATGNRGLVYQPAIPRVEIKMHYWFDFQLALNIGIFFATHTYELNSLTTKVSLNGFEVDLKYYFDVKNSGSALTFANPFLIGGVGSISKTESNVTSSVDQDSTISMNIGAGLEFPVVYKKTYFVLDGRYHTQNFKDTTVTEINGHDLSGGFVTFMGSFLFTW